MSFLSLRDPRWSFCYPQVLLWGLTTSPRLFDGRGKTGEISLKSA
jgi:hypothetical protein